MTSVTIECIDFSSLQNGGIDHEEDNPLANGKSSKVLHHHKRLTIHEEDLSRTASFISEDEIIDNLAKQHKQLQQMEPRSPLPLYEDNAFDPNDPHILYLDPNNPPDYASDLCTKYWYRPSEFTDNPDYFKCTSGCGILRAGSLNDTWLLGVFAALAIHPDNLIENLFVSESLHTFKLYGVYSCRFYKDCKWKTIITDTRLPYDTELTSDEINPPLHGTTPGSLIYGCSVDKNEVFIPLLEKAYAKLYGCYQVLSDTHGGNISSKILEAFVDCTGGSSECIRLDNYTNTIKTNENVGEKQDKHIKDSEVDLWEKLRFFHQRKCILTTQLRQLSTVTNDTTALGVLKNHQYIILHLKEIPINLHQSITTGGRKLSMEIQNGNASSTLRFVKLKNVWGRGMWKGAWGNDDVMWEEYPQVEKAFRDDDSCDFHRSGRDATFWILLPDLINTFTEVYVVHIFPPDSILQYCVHGEWKGQSAAGAPSNLKKRNPYNTNISGPINESHSGSNTTLLPEKQAVKNKGQNDGIKSIVPHTSWAILHDTEAYWYRNPQYKITVQERTKNIHISLLQRDFRLYGGDNFAINFVLLKEKNSRANIVWELNRHHLIAEAHSVLQEHEKHRRGVSKPGSPAILHGKNPNSTLNSNSILPEREISVHNIVLEPNFAYYVIPYTDHLNVPMEYFLRVFSPKKIHIEPLRDIYYGTCFGTWQYIEHGIKDGEVTTSGGPLCAHITSYSHNSSHVDLSEQNAYSTMKSPGENPLWCQNQQFWVRLHLSSVVQKWVDSMANVTLKIVVRRTSQHRLSVIAPNTLSIPATPLKSGQRDHNAKDIGNLIGLTIIRGVPIHNDNGNLKNTSRGTKRALTKSIKTDFLGNVIEKPKWLSHQISTENEQKIKHDQSDNDSNDQKDALPYPRPLVHPEEWVRTSEYSGNQISSIYLRRIPKEWLLPRNGGLIVVPTLGEPNVEGTFELQVACDVPITMTALPNVLSQSFAGEWTNSTAMGCHMHAEWKKNPKFYLQLHDNRIAKVTITLSRSELDWSTKCKRDPVGTMIGFYVFKGMKCARGETSSSIIYNGHPWSETDFVPLSSISTPPQFALPPIGVEPYTIIPSTYAPNNYGTFILTVQCDVKFSLTVDNVYG